MDRFDRALGALLSLFTGDAFGSQTEFDKEKTLFFEYPMACWKVPLITSKLYQSVESRP